MRGVIVSQDILNVYESVFKFYGRCSGVIVRLVMQKPRYQGRPRNALSMPSLLLLHMCLCLVSSVCLVSTLCLLCVFVPRLAGFDSCMFLVSRICKVSTLCLLSICVCLVSSICLVSTLYLLCIFVFSSCWVCFLFVSGFSGLCI